MRNRQLIIHADDLGLARSVNRATFDLLDQGLISSASVMIPCPRFREVAEYAAARPEVDLGVHLTLTSEWDLCRWGSVAPRHKVSSLLDRDGCFYRDRRAFLQHARMAHIEIELRAQIECSLAAGIRLTHVDSHMLALMGSPRLRALASRIAAEYMLPFLSWKGLQAGAVLDGLFMADGKVGSEDWEPFYIQTLQGLQPGVHELIVHPGCDEPELRAITGANGLWDAAWRQRDYDVLRTAAFQAAVRNAAVEVITWKTLNESFQRMAPFASCGLPEKFNSPV